MHPGQATCGAKTRKGSACKDIAMANGRCKRHGGKSSGPKAPAIGTANGKAKFGIYGAYLTDEERDLDIELGSVDAELRLIRIRLKRTLEARAKWETDLLSGGLAGTREDDGNMTFVEQIDDESVTKDGDVVPTKKRTFRLPDFDKIEQACLARIESLEKTRKELAKEGGEPSDDPEGPRDRVAFTGGLGGEDDELPSPFE